MIIYAVVEIFDEWDREIIGYYLSREKAEKIIKKREKEYVNYGYYIREVEVK